MKNFFSKLLGYLFGVIFVFPFLSLVGLLVTCRNYISSIFVSGGFFYLILGFTGISCFFTLSLTIVLTYLGKLTFKKFNVIIDNAMEKKLRELSDDEKIRHNRSMNINNIIGRYGGLN